MGRWEEVCTHRKKENGRIAAVFLTVEQPYPEGEVDGEGDPKKVGDL